MSIDAEAGFESIIPADSGPIVVEVPHAGLVIDAAAARFTKIPRDAAARDAVRADSDIGADLVWAGIEAHGVPRIVARASRYVIDLNTEPRFPTPYEDKMPPGLRVVVHQSQCGLRWRDDALSRAEIERRVRGLFEPYHRAVDAELRRAHQSYGAALLIASHTFPDPRRKIADVVLGTRHGASASESLRDAIAEVIRAHGFSVACEEPFAGGWSTVRHARADEGVNVLQIELARRLVCQSSRDTAPLEIDRDGVGRASAMLRDVVGAARELLARPGAPEGREHAAQSPLPCGG
jgi:N-formylglutamate deformylase